MNEYDWQTSTDPAAMFRLASGRVSLCCGCYWCNNGDGTWSLAEHPPKCCPKCDNARPVEGYRKIGSERKLRLWCCACVCILKGDNFKADEYEEFGAGGSDYDWARRWSYPTVEGWGRGVDKVAAQQRADAMRSIFGNPYRPFLPTCEACCRGSVPTDLDDNTCEVCGGTGHALPVRIMTANGWQVRRLAEAAYQDRLPDGQLDPNALAVLSDSLLDAGLPDQVEQPCPRCSLYADDPCPRCNGAGYGKAPRPISNPTCTACNGTGKFPPGYHPECDPASGRHEGGWTNCQRCHMKGVVRVTHPLLTSLRDGKPKWRGYWVTDLLLGKE